MVCAVEVMSGGPTDEPAVERFPGLPRAEQSAGYRRGWALCASRNDQPRSDDRVGGRTGPRFPCCRPDLGSPPVKVTHTNPRTGQRESHFEEFTDDDQRTIDEFVNFGLQLAGIAKFPSGFDWYVRVPSRIKDAAELADELRAKNSAPDEVEALTIITATYNRLLAD